MINTRKRKRVKFNFDNLDPRVVAGAAGASVGSLVLASAAGLTKAQKKINKWYSARNKKRQKLRQLLKDELRQQQKDALQKSATQKKKMVRR